MSEYSIYELLQSKGIATPKYKRLALDEDANVDFYPVVLKFASDRVVHKSEVGAVVTNIHNRVELQDAKEKILGNLAAHGIAPAREDEWIVCKSYTGIELFFGIIQDKIFEKVIVFGAGGVLAELFADVCFIDSEADENEIKTAIAQTKIGVLFTKGFRGVKYDIDMVVDFIKKLQHLDYKELDLNPVLMTADSLTVVDARGIPGKPEYLNKTMKQLPELFNPQRIAIIGVSGSKDKVGYALAKNTCNREEVLFVNPKLTSLFGKKVYNTIEDLPAIDTAVLAIPVTAVEEAIEKLVTKLVKNVIIITAGFKESGGDDYFLHALTEKYGINIIGPNCLGVYTHGINLTFGTTEVKEGDINFFSQSGAIAAELMDRGVLKNIGFENIVSVGNMVDIDFADLIASYKGKNPINIYLEGTPNGKNLLRAIRKSRVPVNIFKAGKSEAARKAAYSHTGNLAGNYEMFTGLLRSVGARLLHNTSGLLYGWRFDKILVITNAGGAGTVISDLLGSHLYELSAAQKEIFNMVLPSGWSHNDPVDIIGDATAERYLQALQVADTLQADAIYVIITPQLMTDPKKISELFVENTFSKKIFPILLGGAIMEEAKQYLMDNKVLFFTELEEAVSFL